MLGNSIDSGTDAVFEIESMYFENAAFGQATLTIPGANISIPLAANSLGNLTAHTASNQQANQATTQQAQQNQAVNQTATGGTTTQAQQQQAAQQSVNIYFGLFFGLIHPIHKIWEWKNHRII